MNDLFTRSINAIESYKNEISAIFDEVEKQDPDLANLIIATFEDRLSGATWFLTKTHTTYGKTPIELVCDGEQERVLELLYTN